MKKIMFVCHGNICRSPMAEMIFDQRARECGLSGSLTAFSSATSSEELGNPVYPPVRRLLEKRGIPLKEHYATRLKPDDYEKYDLFIVMDENNMRNIRHILSTDPENKIHKLLSFAGLDADVSDPYYTGDFNKTFEDISLGVEALIKKLS